MHDHMRMDTSEPPAQREGVNGALVIASTLETSALNSKMSPSTSEPNHVQMIASTLAGPMTTAELPISTSLAVVTSFPSSVASFCPHQPDCQVPRTSPIQIIPNSVDLPAEVPNQKPSPSLVQNSLSNHVNHTVPIITIDRSTIANLLPPMSLPNFTQQPPDIAIGPRVLNPQNQVGIFEKPSAITIHQSVLQHHVPLSSPSTMPTPSTPVQSLPLLTVQIPTTNGIDLNQECQQFPSFHPPDPSKALPISPCGIPGLPKEGQTSLAVTSANGPGTSAKNANEIIEDESSDTDIEIKSLDLTSHVGAEEVIEGERERPMSWEGELSTEVLTNKAQEEEQMKIEKEEAMSPMSPMSPSSDNEQEAINERIKSEEMVADLPNAVFTTQSIPQMDSPIPARSDSGCELHVGPFTPTQSPLMSRIHAHQHSPTHLYSPTQSPSQSRHLSGFSSPYSHSPSTGLSRNNSDASQYGGSYNSYSSAPSPISPTHYSPSQSPNLSRMGGNNHGVFLGTQIDLREHHGTTNLGVLSDCAKELKDDVAGSDLSQHSLLAGQSGITRQQLINSPCPICGDKISGFHYGIFSCESCKGFFKRTVQNKKNYVCMRGSSCPVTIATRKKCPACRFDKCLRKGMKLEAIREDRTRGGRSTYQCAPYTLPPSLMGATAGMSIDQPRLTDGAFVKSEPPEEDIKPSSSRGRLPIPLLLQQIHDVEHLWHCSEAEMSQIRQSDSVAREAMESDSSDLCKIAEGRLYKIVKWCKSLPLFRHISIDDQIILLMNSWCELLLLSCCFRSMDSPGEVRVSSGRTMTQAQAETMGIGPCIERMLSLSYQLRRLQVDRFEYMAMKVIVLLTSDVAGLKEGEKVRYSQKKVLQALQEYTLSHYPHLPSKFGELLLRIPELQRTCHASKDMLSVKKKEGDVPGFNFLFDLLRGDH